MAATSRDIRIIRSMKSSRRRETPSSFRGDAKHRTRNLEIPGLVLTHHPGMMTTSSFLRLVDRQHLQRRCIGLDAKGVRGDQADLVQWRLFEIAAGGLAHRLLALAY